MKNLNKKLAKNEKTKNYCIITCSYLRKPLLKREKVNRKLDKNRVLLYT